MMNHHALPISPMAPTSYDEPLLVSGLRFDAIAAGLKYQDRPDYLLLCLEAGTIMAGVFTQSTTAAAPVILSKQALNQSQGAARAILINAGNANAFTGKPGFKIAQACQQELARLLQTSPHQILLASTGVIGEVPEKDKMLSPLPGLVQRVKNQKNQDRQDWMLAAKAIATTDTYPKFASETCIIEGKKVNLCGIAKGSGMIAPNMATMLGFIACDATISADILQALLRQAVDKSFNAISVDSDMSTNDTVFLAATGKANHRLINDIKDNALKDFKAALKRLCLRLALMVVKDGEGASKLIAIRIEQAASQKQAKKVARAIGDSPLIKTAIAGEDANWGRIVMAVGKSGVKMDMDKLMIAIGGVPITAQGKCLDDYDESQLAKHLQGQDIQIKVALGVGKASYDFWSCDLTHGYIDINADYRS